MKLLILFLLFGCASSTQNALMQPTTFYQRDMILNINGLISIGTAVMPKADHYDFDVTSAGPLDMFVMSTCSKEESKQSAGNVTETVHSGLFGWGSKVITIPNRVKFTYYQTDIEADGNCPMELSGFDSTGGQNTWAFIDFESDTYNLPAHVECNGSSYDSKGTTVCQSRAGLVQKLTFDSPVSVAVNNPCGIALSVPKTSYEITLPIGRCTAIFKSQDKKFHKFTSLGYQNILMRVKNAN